MLPTPKLPALRLQKYEHSIPYRYLRYGFKRTNIAYPAVAGLAAPKQATVRRFGGERI